MQWIVGTGAWLAVIVSFCATLQAEQVIDRPDDFGTILGWPTAVEGRYPVGTPPGQGWNFISGDGKTFSSPCIGKPRSPQCLVDTMMACSMWTDTGAGWPSETDKEEYYSHPICKALMNDPIHPGRGIRVFFDPGRHPENDMIYYKLDSRVVDQAMLETEGAPWSLIDPKDCDICVGDTAIIPLIISCYPDPRLANVPRGGTVHRALDYPPNSPFTYCVDDSSILKALFTRKHPVLDEWYAAWVFNPGDMGSMGRAWPLVEEWIIEFHQEALPGTCAPDIYRAENCPEGHQWTR